jgi:hypothetical protein
VTLDPEAAERAFIEIYRDPEALRFMIRRLIKTGYAASAAGSWAGLKVP